MPMGRPGGPGGGMPPHGGGMRGHMGGPMRGPMMPPPPRWRRGCCLGGCVMPIIYVVGIITALIIIL